MNSAFGVDHGYVSKADRTAAASSVAGATAGQLIYQGAGYGSKKAIRRGYGHNTPAGQITKPKVKARKKTWEQAKKTQRKKGFSPVDAETKAQFWRTLPKDVHGARVLRTAGWTHAGKTGMATGAASTAAGGVAGYLAMKKEKK